MFIVKCLKCSHVFSCKGSNDYESIDGIGGYTGVELDECECPECGNDTVEIIDEEYEDNYLE